MDMMCEIRRSPRRLAGCALLFAVLHATPAAGADPPPAPSPSAPSASADAPSPADAATERGRQAFLDGVKLSRAEQWGDALAAFEAAAAARDAPLVQFNIAYCQRALGRYVAARETTRRVLSDPTGLAPSMVEDAKGYLAEFEKVLVETKVTLDPPTAKLTVDGRPLLPAKDQSGTFLASLAPPGEGSSPGKKELTVVLDPGVHLFRAVRPGHQDAVVQKSYRAGEKARLDLRLDILPATVSLKSEPAASIVRIDKREVGVAPIEFQRPAGRYKLEVVQDNFVTHTSTLDLKPGQRTDLPIKLEPYVPPIYTRWWFWTGAAAVVAGGVVLTYALTRPDPVPPPYDGGSTGWVVQPPPDDETMGWVVRPQRFRW
jgi:hypothetical protein